MVEGSTHDVGPLMIAMAHLIIMQLHDGVPLVIVVSLTPHIVSLLRTLVQRDMTRVFGRIQHLLVWL